METKTPCRCTVRPAGEDHTPRSSSAAAMRGRIATSGRETATARFRWREEVSNTPSRHATAAEKAKTWSEQKRRRPYRNNRIQSKRVVPPIYELCAAKRRGVLPQNRDDTVDGRAQSKRPETMAGMDGGSQDGSLWYAVWQLCLCASRTTSGGKPRRQQTASPPGRHAGRGRGVPTRRRGTDQTYKLQLPEDGNGRGARWERFWGGGRHAQAHRG